MTLMTELQTIKKAADMTDREIIDAMDARDIRAKVRFIFSIWSARIEQAHAQAKPPSPIAIRRMELQAAEQIMAEIWQSIGAAHDSH